MQRFDSISEILSSKGTNPFIISLLTFLQTLILNFLAALEDFSSFFHFFLHSSSVMKHSICNEEAKCGMTMKKGDVEVVMGALGMHWDCDGDEEVEVCNVFDVKEASMDEMKQAFDMFDSDEDGFIDAKDLKKMLCCLGFQKFSEWDCLKMIFASSTDNSDSIESSSGIGFENFVQLLNG